MDGPYSMRHTGYRRHRIWTAPGPKYNGAGPHSIGNMDPGPFSMGSIFYMTSAVMRHLTVFSITSTFEILI